MARSKNDRRKKATRRRNRKAAKQVRTDAQNAQPDRITAEIAMVTKMSGTPAAIIVTDDRDATVRGAVLQGRPSDGVHIHLADEQSSAVPVAVLLGTEMHLWTANPAGAASTELRRQLPLLAECFSRGQSIVPADKDAIIVHKNQVDMFLAVVGVQTSTGIQVGDRLQEYVGIPDGAHYNFNAAGHVLTVAMRTPDAAEIVAFEGGRVDLGLMVRTEAVFFTARFRHGDTSYWHDATYSVHRVPREERGSPDVDLPPGQGHPLVMILVDSATGEVVAVRIITMTHRFSLALAKAIAQQIASPGEGRHHDRIVDETFHRYPTTADIARAAEVRMTAPAKLGATAIA